MQPCSRSGAPSRCATAAAGAGAAGGSERITDGERNLAMERAKATFKVRELTLYLDGGAKITAFREKAMRELEALPVFRQDDRFDLTRPESRKRTMEKVRGLYRAFVKDARSEGGLDMRRARLEAAGLLDPGWFTRNGVHFGLFMGAISGQGTQEQQQEWLPQVFMLSIFGCFGMTELGHGSHVRGLETVATYIPESQEFDIHSPTLTATKWWIGGAGQTATHCSVFARLVVDGDDKGVHCFVVQLRDTETHAPMPGVSVGDCGAKMGRNGLDNGWIQFHHVRIPREQMLMKHAQVSPEGVYTKPPRAAAAYGALILGRAHMVKDSYDVLKAALTIVIRYTCVRRQGEPFREGEPEPQILNYTSMQARLLPTLAQCYAFYFTSRFMIDMLDRFNEKDGGGGGGDDAEAAEMLPDLHATSAGLKAYCTWYTLEAIEKCRQCCGGHGYSGYAGLAAMFADFAVQCTWEGDNTVMALQTARYLVSSLRKLRDGQEVQGSVRYLAEKLPASWDAATAAQVRDPRRQLVALRFQAATLVRAAVAALDERTAAGASETEAWNATAVPLLRASKAHVYYNMASFFVHGVEARMADEAEDPSLADSGVGAICKTLCDLFVLHYMADTMGYFLRSSFMSPTQADLIDREVAASFVPVRANAVPLVDAFNLSDFVLNSPLGRYDGRVYEAYFEQVRRSPYGTSTAPYFETTIKPMLEGADVGGGDDSDDADDDDDDGSE